MVRSAMNLANSDVAETVASELPTGTVTFLLSDIEGSTRLWEAGADDTAASIARHYDLLNAAIALHAASSHHDSCFRNRRARNSAEATMAICQTAIVDTRKLKR